MKVLSRKMLIRAHITQIDDQIEKCVCGSNNLDSFIKEMNLLWLLIRNIDDTDIVTGILNSNAFSSMQRACRGPWNRYIKELEHIRSAEKLNGSCTHERSVLAEEDYKGIICELDLLTVKSEPLNIVVLGCGPYPETLIEIYKSGIHIKELIGIDNDPHAVASANLIIAQSTAVQSKDRTNVRSVILNAQDVNYANIDVILIANGLQGKNQAVESILKSAPGHVQILCRNPLRLAHLFYENLNSENQSSKIEFRSSVQASSLSSTSLVVRKAGSLS